jgi:superfamily I DNA/RNA helicase
MSLTLSEEQIAYLKAKGKVILNACPGSGKTTTVAHKLYSLIHNCESNFYKNAGVVCLSFTNVAKNEIAEKFKEINGFTLPYPHVISTIDSFINSYITLPFAHKLNRIDRRYHIIDNIEYLDKVFQSNWQLIAAHKKYIFAYSPSKIDFTLSGSFSWDGHDKSADVNFLKYAKDIKETQINMGLLKTSDSAFFAYHILNKFPRLAEYLAARFSYIIIDEAQDTSEIQYSILEMLAKGGIENIDLVGDPYQCLYQWRDANPELFLQKFDDAENWNGIYLTENRRSTKRIIDAFSILRRKSDKAIVPVINSETDFPLHIIKYNSSDYAKAIINYERLCRVNKLASNTVLVRGNALKNSLLGNENNYSPWNNSLPYLLVESKIHLQSNEIKEAIKIVRRIIIELLCPKITLSDLKDKEQELKNDKEVNVHIFNLIRSLPSFDLSLIEWTIQTQQYLKTVLELENVPDFQIRKKNTATFDKTTLQNPVKQYFRKSITDNNLPVTTIHQVKGKTFDSVFLILSGDSKGQNISLNDFELKEEIPNEKQRMIYVAMSRPRHLLCIGVPETVTDDELKRRFSENIVVL